MTEEIQKVFYSHDQFITDLHIILRKIQLSGYMPDYVVGIARGGLLPATYLSHYLDKPFEVCHLSYRDSENNNIVDACSKLHHLNRWGKKLLIVDDICDSGKTLHALKSELGSWHELNRICVLHNNFDQEECKPEYWAQQLNKKEKPIWIEYFYEKWWVNS